MGFLRLGCFMENFCGDASVINDCIIVAHRVQIPNSLRKAVLVRLYRTHPDQEAMVDAAQYLWWPKMQREVIVVFQSCRSCSAYVKDLKTSKPFTTLQNLVRPLRSEQRASNELCLSHVGFKRLRIGRKVYTDSEKKAQSIWTQTLRIINQQSNRY